MQVNKNNLDDLLKIAVRPVSVKPNNLNMGFMLRKKFISKDEI
jgi:hypothetical protein